MTTTNPAQNTTTHPAQNTTVVFHSSDALYDLVQGFMGVVLTYTSANSSLETNVTTTATSIYTTTTAITTETSEPTIPEGTKCISPTGCPPSQACFASNDSVECLDDDTIGFRMMLRSPCMTSSNSAISSCLTFVWTGPYSWVNQQCTHLPNSPDLVNLTVSNVNLKTDLKYLGDCSPDAYCSSMNNTCEPHLPNGTACDSDLLCIPINPGRCIANVCDGSYATTVTIPIRSTSANSESGSESESAIVAIIVCCVLGAALLFSCAMWCLLCRGKKVDMVGLRYMRGHEDDMPMEQTVDGVGSTTAESMASIEGNQLELMPPPPYSAS